MGVKLSAFIAVVAGLGLFMLHDKIFAFLGLELFGRLIDSFAFGLLIFIVSFLLGLALSKKEELPELKESEKKKK